MRTIGILFCLISAAAPLLAAETSSTDSNVLEEVTVTAQRRSESLQTVPIAITAVTATDMERNGVHALGTLATQVPGLTFSPYAPGQNIVALRGVSSNDDGAGTDNSVAVFVDDVWDNTSQYSEELRWVSLPTDRLKYVGGLWFMREDTNRLRMFYLPSVDPDPDASDRYRGIDRTTSE